MMAAFLELIFQLGAGESDNKQGTSLMSEWYSLLGGHGTMMKRKQSGEGAPGRARWPPQTQLRAAESQQQGRQLCGRLRGEKEGCSRGRD